MRDNPKNSLLVFNKEYFEITYEPVSTTRHEHTDDLRIAIRNAVKDIFDEQGEDDGGWSVWDRAYEAAWDVIARQMSCGIHELVKCHYLFEDEFKERDYTSAEQWIYQVVAYSLDLIEVKTRNEESMKLRWLDNFTWQEQEIPLEHFEKYLKESDESAPFDVKMERFIHAFDIVNKSPIRLGWDGVYSVCVDGGVMAGCPGRYALLSSVQMALDNMERDRIHNETF